MARRKKGRLVDGLLLLNKPKGGSSNGALQTVKRLYFAQKAGHTGNLDPMATGVLPICFGEATKFSQYHLDADKAYTATLRFGEVTETGDVEGSILQSVDASAVTEVDVAIAIESFRGEITQVPPMYSALKVNGQPLYKLARQGIEVERKERQVTIYELTLLAFRENGAHPEADISVRCSKGTYIRTLAEDIGTMLNVGAHLIALERTQAGPFHLQDCINIEDLESLKENEDFEAMDNLLLPAEQAVNHFPLVEVEETAGYYIRLGQAVLVPKAPTEGLVRIRTEQGEFLGIGKILDDGRVTPRRLIASDGQ
ncbi:tRNA pseudouridine synthase B [BD1-7 clade bacterium]|uniref:tRNA pseudouridine synthase B n=1 Tax=BD1-7 clade bacterium TaxID=2029982 RepID=A0A5S9N3M6_9GAMM|nr:tRNA pseudouridine synthase B [BD1-7 clade bacterium]CAA0084370.1 tRNA pseudouridine synthase B [BD1-7 clade bacterium]